MPPSPEQAWFFLPIGYLLTVAVEVPILLIGLSPGHRLRDRLWAGFWLTACTYPVVVLVLPYWIWQPYGRGAYLVVAEVFAPVAECALFLAAYYAIKANHGGRMSEPTAPAAGSAESSDASAFSSPQNQGWTEHHGRRRNPPVLMIARDLGTIVVANLASFLVGEFFLWRLS